MSPSEKYEEFGGRWRLHERQRVALAAGAVLITVLITAADAFSGGGAGGVGGSSGGAVASGSAGARDVPRVPGLPRGGLLASGAPAVAPPVRVPGRATPGAVSPALVVSAPGSVAAVHAAPKSVAVSAADARGRIALDFALAQIGKPYRYGASGPNAYDCSGLAQRSWRAAGVSIPRTTEQQAHFGSAVPLSQIQPGDLVIFYADASHVGIYAGHGDVVVAPHAGTVVTVQQMRWMPINTVRRPG